MRTLINELINQYFPDSEELPLQMVAFLEELKTTMDGNSLENIQEVDNLASQEKRAHFAEIANTLVQELAEIQEIPLVIERLTSQVQKRLGFSRVNFFSLNRAANNLRLTAAAGKNVDLPKEQHAILPLNVGAVGKAAAFENTVVASSKDLNLTNPPDMLESDTKSQAAIPVIFGSQFLGVLDVQNNIDTKLDPDLVLSLETLCLHTAILLNGLQFKNEILERMDELSSLQRMASSEGWKSFREISSLKSNRFLYDQNLNSAVPLESEFQPVDPIKKPLQIRGEVIGTIGVSTDSDQPLSAEEKNLLESISSEVAEALERARLFETSQRSASELAVLNEMGAAFAQAENEEFITENIYKYASKLMETPEFYVSLYHEEEQMISFPYVVTQGERVIEGHPEFQQWYSRPVGTGLTGYIIEKKLPILIDSNAEKTLKELGLPFLRFGQETHSWLGVPIIIGDRVLGVISVQSEEVPNLYNRHHLDLLTTIASQAAVAINNTRLFNQEQERAHQERTVRTITDKVRRGTDTHNIMQIALKELSQVLDADIASIQLGSQEDLLNARQNSAEVPTQTQNTHENT